MKGRAVTACRARLRAKAAALSLMALAGLAARPLHAQDVSDPVAGGRQLKSARVRSPGQPASGFTGDVGQISVIEHDGSNYDKNDGSGAPNYLARAAVARRFFETHGDNYDFLVVFTNFEFDTDGALAFHGTVRNDVRGINKPLVDFGNEFGSPGRLKGYVDMAALARYRVPPRSVDPGQPGFAATLGTVAHEIAHQWAATVRYRTAGGTDVADLLGIDSTHWSYLLDSDASFLYGSEWVPGGQGLFRAERVMESFSSLDLYLMGLLDSSRVAPFSLLRNGSVDPRQLPVEGDSVAATPETVHVDQVIAAEGLRSPGAQVSQKEFRVAFIYLTAQGTEPAAEDLAAIDRVREAVAGHFFFNTRGLAVADTSLVETPAPPTAPVPDLDLALAWLLARQASDGRWQDSPGTAARDTAAAIEALEPAPTARAAVEAARAWLRPLAQPTVDYVARRALVLAPPATPSERDELAGAVLPLAAPDGGFGIARGYLSDALDTALALRALAALGRPADASVLGALAALAALRHPSGGWALVPGGEVSAVVTAEAVLALQAWPDVPPAQALVPPALAALLLRRNPDGGFGESPSSPYATALALRALLAAHAPANVVDGATAWLQGHQLEDGSWGSVYSTALVLGALRASLGPNLLVPHDSLRIEPPTATEGQVVSVSAVVRNAGRAAAPAQQVRLYDGDPALGEVAGEMAVGPLGVGEEAPVHFDFDTTGRAGARTLYVVADWADAVRESREDDNAASRALSVSGLLPDLEVGPFDVSVSPYPPEEGETVSVSVTVHNRGPRASAATALDLTRGDPRSGGQAIGRAPVPAIAPGGSATVTLSWNTSGQLGTHELFASADAEFRLPESDETNNEASQQVEVTAPLPPGPDLELALLLAVPGRLSTIPQDGTVEALVRNLGRDPASAAVALHDGSPSGPQLGEQAVSLGPRSSVRLTFPIRLEAPGSHTFVAVADPTNAVSETREDNNSASASFVDGQDTIDLELPPGGVVPSSVDLVVGETLTVRATVRNRGTAAVGDVPVILAHVTADGPVELARRLVSLQPATSAEVELPWVTSVLGESVPLAVIVDPFQLLNELSEANNRTELAVRIRPSSLPNLKVTAADIAFVPDPPQQGGSATVTVTVRNTGTVDAPAFAVQFFRNDPASGGTLIGEAAVPGVAPGSSAAASVVWSPVDATGNTLVFAVADSGGQVAEYDETDNRAFRAVGVLSLPDLVLTTGDVALTPAFPRAGEAVSIRATVRNLGGQPTPATTLRAWEGEAGGGTVIGDAPIPPLQPQQAELVTLSWTPASPPGEVTLTVAADADDAASELDEGNNRARRQVVIQNADLYLTAPYFSPDGDGAIDDTTLAWRATGTVDVVVSDSRGARVRTLATSAPAEGSVSWDGRDERGRLLWDGAYALTVEGAGGVALGRATAVLDTNRSPIHDAAATGLVALRNLTCRLPNVGGPAWMPAEDEALFIVSTAGLGVDPGLIRVGLDGEWSYVGTGPDPWYEYGGTLETTRAFVSDAAVSPDGREVLISTGTSDLVGVDLVTGQRRTVSGSSGLATWSPDGRWIALGNRVLSRDGSQQLDLPSSAFAWSPDSQSLTNGRTIVRRDGSGESAVPWPIEEHVEEVQWLPDGRIYARLRPEQGLEGGESQLPQSFFFDPDTGEAVAAPWLDSIFVPTFHFTPNGGKAAFRRSGEPAHVVRPDGAELRLLDPGNGGSGFSVSPRRGIASYFSDVAAQPGQPCAGMGSDLFALSSLHNLTLDLQAVRLPANNGLLVKGTAADAHLDHHQLEYATAADPNDWRPIGPASAVPVIDDVLTVWVPPAPGTYLLRLRGLDRAGNARSRTRVVAWDRVPALANLAQSERLISPTGDGVKDSVLFTYLVVEPSQVDVQITGPERPGQPPAPVVRRIQLSHPAPGPAGFEWDGRDGNGGVVADGRYTVSVNGIPFRVDVDATPPDLAWSYHDLRSRAVPGAPPPRRGVVTAQRRWHVVDPHLSSWSYRSAFFEAHDGGQVYEPERDAQGNIIYVDGVPKIRYEGPRPADTRLEDTQVQNLGTDPTAMFTASDHAGNRSTVPVLPVPERLFLLAAYRFPPDGSDAVLALGVPVGSDPVVLTPLSAFELGETLRDSPPGPQLRFEYRPAGTAQWIAGPSFGGRTWTADFAALALSPSTVHQARFLGEGTPAVSEQFSFLLCEATGSLTLEPPTPIPGSPLVSYRLRVNAESAADPIVAARVMTSGPGGFQANAPMERQPDGSFVKTVVAPHGDCDTGRVSFVVLLGGESGREYLHDEHCRNLIVRYPSPCLGNALRQHFPFCAGQTDRAYFNVSAAGLPDGTVTLTAGNVPLGAFEITAGQAPARVSMDARSLPEGRVTVFAAHENGPSLDVIGPENDEDVEVGPDLPPGPLTFVDQTPQAATIVAPPELGRLCVAHGPSRDTATILIQATELGREVELGEGAEYRKTGGEWEELKAVATKEPVRIPTGGPRGVVWDVTGLSDGEYSVRLPTCDRAGHSATSERRFRLARTPPALHLAVGRPFFSPNGDGRADETVAVLEVTQALRVTVEVQRESTGAVVRRLVTDQPYEAGQHLFAWDGRDDANQPVPDGRYAVVARARDECDNTAIARALVDLDTEPPLASIVTPVAGQPVVTGIDVRGIADDPHLSYFELSFGAGAAPDSWTPFATGVTAVPPPGGLLGRWDTPQEEGPYTLRMQVTDRAENVAEARVTVSVSVPTLLERLGVAPAAFSPNADGQADSATVEYVLKVVATVRLEVRSASGALLRTLVPPTLQPPGLHSVAWDGNDDGAAPAPEGEHEVRIVAEEAPVTEQASTALVLDRTPPVVAVTAPAAGAYVTPQAAVRGSVHDAHLASFVVRAASENAPEIEIARGQAEVTDGDLALLTVLQEGPHRLTVLAEDTASNRFSVEVPVVLDAEPPRASLLPLGPVLHRGASAVAVSGTAADANLDEYVLSFGAGAQPAAFVEIARGTTSVDGGPLGQWAVASVPDGTYTLRLEVRDKAGRASEARLTLVLDGTDPTAAIVAPADGARVNAEIEVRGSATDANFEEWTLEMAPGPANQAHQWTLVATSDSPVVDAALASLAPLPPDGLHTLRLTVRDEADHAATATRTFKVDTTPPAPPGGLQAELLREEGTADVRLHWTAVPDAELAGYLVSRDGTVLTPSPIAATAFLDADRGDGSYRYGVQAVDAAGNASAPAELTVRADLTPPIVDLTHPRAAQAVSGSVDVRGTAFSADDFKEYRLLVGAGAAPSSWTLLKRSSLPVAASTLGAWQAIGQGPFVLALEAEDTSGNAARTTVAVTVDNQAPAAPVLSSLVNQPAGDALTATWQPSPDPDVDGYLVYRNGLLANAGGVVVGDLRPYLVPGPAYVDSALPDGQHCYRVAAMDAAGNVSAGSNELCHALDNRRPHAVVVEPPDGTRFEFPVRVLADTPDLDVLSVQFQLKPQADTTWQSLGPADGQRPFEVTLDPASLAAGPYNVRALARDAAGEDPSPAAITIVYGDTTPPAVPQGLDARVDAHDVHLSWTANTEDDLAGYVVWRDEQRITPAPVAEAVFDDTVAEPGAYRYRVSAIDGDGNESARSAAADALVYVLRLEPAFPVTLAQASDLPGEGAAENTTIEVRREGTLIAQAPAVTPGAFTVPAVPLVDGPNLLTAQGVDASGNRSIPSAEVVLIANRAPPAVTSLAASVDGHAVDLAWTPAPDADVFGHDVARGAIDLTPPVAQTEFAAVSASSTAGPGFEPERAFDGDPETAWFAAAGTTSATWTVTFPAAVLVRRLGLSFPIPAAEYSIDALWEGRFVTLARARGNQDASVEHTLPSPFATDTLKVSLTGPRPSLNEVTVETRGRLTAAPAYRDESVPDGTHEYAVTAIDRYGADAPPARVTVAVGDVIAPAAPTGLSAVVEAGDVLLAWNAAPETDFSHYVVHRDSLAVATVSQPSYADRGLPNGEYRYSVLAVDTAGNRSPLSAEVTATVALAPPAAPSLSAAALPNGAVALAWTHAGAPQFVVQRGDASGGPYAVVGRTGDTRSFLDGSAARGVAHFYVVSAVDARGNASPLSNEAEATPERTAPPAAPVLLRPTDADHPLAWPFTETAVEGRAEPRSLVSLEADGTLRGVVEAGDAFALTAGAGLPEGALAPVVSPDGRRVAYAMQVPAPALIWQDVESGASGFVQHPGADALAAQAFAPAEHRLLYRSSTCDGAGACASNLYTVDLGTGAVAAVEDGEEDARDAAWSPDGTWIAYTIGSPTSCALWVRELPSAQTRSIATAAACGRPRFAPDSARVALVARPEGGATHQLWVVDVASAAVAVVTDGAWGAGAPSWSRDGTRIAYTRDAAGALRARVIEVPGGPGFDLAEPQAPSFDPQFDPGGGWVSFVTVRATPEGAVRDLVAESLDRGGQARVATLPGGSEAGPFTLHAWTRHHTLAVSLPDRVALLAAEGQFRFDAVRLRPGQNVLVARATDADEGLTGPDSRPIALTVPADLFADLALTADDLGTYPSIPAAGQSTLLKAHVGNAGAAPAYDVPVLLTVRDGSGATLFEQEARVSEIPAGQAAWVTALWQPQSQGTYGFRTEADPADALAEAREDNNRADRGVLVAAPAGLTIHVSCDRMEYEANSPALVTVQVTNGGAAFSGEVRTAVEAAGAPVAAIDTRTLTLQYGQSAQYTLNWNTGTTYAGDYTFATRAAGPAGPVHSVQPFRILPDVRVTARLRPVQADVPLGAPASFTAEVDNDSLNTPLDAVARLRVVPDGQPDPAFTAEVPLPRILPGGAWQGTLTWPSAQPAGRYRAEMDVVAAPATVASASTAFDVDAPGGSLVGTLSVPAHVGRGTEVEAEASVTNDGAVALPGTVFNVEIASGETGDVLVTGTFTLDLPPGETGTATVTLPTAGVVAGSYPVFLRRADPLFTLDRATLHVHGPLGPPSIDSPAVGARVPTSHPTLVVNNAAAPSGAEVLYDFQLFADAALTRPLPGAIGVAEGVERTSWRVMANLAEDGTYHWRARAREGVAIGPWSSVGSFTVDEVNHAPGAPRPESPADGARVPSREPLLVARNAADPEQDPLTYDFRVAEDPAMSTVVSSISGLPEGPGLTSWRVPVTLTENQTYYWDARVSDGQSSSVWSDPVSFMVDTLDEPPTAPETSQPEPGGETPLLQPALVVGNAIDPEGQPLTYLFEVDLVPTFDSPALQVSPAVPEGPGETAWTPQPLRDNSLHYWRVAAHDGNSSGPFAESTFFVNQANDPPEAPTPLAPTSGAVVGTPTPTLRARNAADVDGDELSYEFEVRDESGATVVASAAGILEGSEETSWTVTPPLSENTRFLWRARANDGQALGPWSEPQLFLVNAVADPPTAPTLLEPLEGEDVEVLRPTLLVANAISPDGEVLTYTFELHKLVNGTPTFVDGAAGVPEGVETTSWTPTSDLAAGDYQWRCRASDPDQEGPWMATASFRVVLDEPPSAPQGLAAVPGDGRVTLGWTANPEPDVVAYHVYRSGTAGGPYTLRATVNTLLFTDTGLTNGVTVYYVVTALDAQFESARSTEAAATPRPSVLPAEIRYTPDSIPAECLLGCGCWNGESCPQWLYATIELPFPFDPTKIIRASVRLVGTASPDPEYWKLIDRDLDGIEELELRFGREKLPPLLQPGTNEPSVSGQIDGGADFRGTARLEATPFRLDLWVTPRTLKKSSNGNDVEAQLTFADCVRAGDVQVSSLRLNGVVPVKKVVSTHGNRITVKFSRAAVAAILPLGPAVEVKVTGTIRGKPFTGIDHIEVIP